MIVRTMNALYVLIFFSHWISLSSAISNVESIKNKCKGECGSNLILSNEGSLLFCDEDCQRNQCHEGCEVYQEALSSSCQKSCTSRESPQKQNCEQGCTFALEIYFNRTVDALVPLPQPELIRSSKKHSSVILQWSGRVMNDVKCLIHRKILDIPQVNAEWQLHNSSRVLSNGQIFIYNLHSYVTYKFKIVAVIVPLAHGYIESGPTKPITTLPNGVPSSAPKITSLSAPSPSVLSIAWTSPTFSNGPILAYKITIDPINHPSLSKMTKDILGQATSWTVGQLQPSQDYKVTVSASNRAGEGPADMRHIRTPNPGNLSANETPYLILGTANKVVKQNLIALYSEPDTLLEEQNKSTLITGIGIHIRRQMYIVSDSNETVQQISLTADSSRQNIYPSILKPTSISVDWLNDRVYVVSRNRIFSCPLDRDACLVVVDNLPRTVSDIKVDPVNGFLYFTQDGQGQGLYRIDLADISRNKPVTPVRIVTTDNLKAFVIDFENVRLYFPNDTENTMLSAFVDGSDIETFHANVILPNYRHIVSLTYYDNLFYWTNGSAVLLEEFDSRFNKYRHNPLLFFENFFRGLNLYHPRMQPTPVAHASPMNLQALFKSHQVYIKWEPPPKLQYQGRGVWKGWSYELHLFETERQDVRREILNSSQQEVMIENLKPDTRYSIRVRAISDAGYGPWSHDFKGQTLKAEKIPVRVLMSTPQEILETDLSDNTRETLITFNQGTSSQQATDLAWHQHLLMWTSAAGMVNVLDRRNQIKRNISNVGCAVCLAYDWLGEKIFWSEPCMGVIKRSDLNGLTSDFVYHTTARDIAIDSATGRLYWATTISIESTFLNGEDHVQIDSVPFFQGKHVISLVLNFDLKKVLWYIKAFERQDLYMADLIGLGGSTARDIRSTVQTLADFRSISQSSGLQYYSHHLFWLDQTNALVVGDLEANYTSVLSSKSSNITAFSVKHPTIQSYPSGLDRSTISVIPKPMKYSSIRVSGPSSNFNLTWHQDHEVNYGSVFYKVYLKISSKSTHIITSKTWHTIEALSPYMQMTVSIQPYTYWGYAETSTVSIRSPMAVPTEPQTPRVYVTQRKNTTTSQLLLAADFRWSTPKAIRGILSHHFVYYWMQGMEHQQEKARVGGVFRHFILNNLLSNKTYFFQVEACTEAGCGPKSEVRSAMTSAVNPVPRLLIATKSNVRLSEMDGHLNSTVLLPEISPTATTFLAQDQRTFWIQKNRALCVSQESDNSALVNLNGKGKDLSIDWISRTLYLVEEVSSKRNNIMGFDIDQNTYREILTRDASVGSVISDPYTSSLYWTESDSSGKGHIFHRPFDTLSVIDLLSNDRRKRRFVRNCTCTDRLNVAPVVAMDYSNSGGTEIFFTDVPTRSIMASDGLGCHCKEIFRASYDDKRGLPPDLLAVDHMRVYWYNKSEEILYSINKHTGKDYFEQSISDVQDIIGYGDHLQPLPDSDCLDPGEYKGAVTLIEVTNTSMTLQLDKVKRPEHCGGISSPQDKYTVYYKNLSSATSRSTADCSGETGACLKKETYKEILMLTNLKPYSQYLVQVAVSNYYTEYLSEAMGKQVTFATKPGVPSAAYNVTAYVLNPDNILVLWSPPLIPNGPVENISYIVKWSTFNSKGVNLESQTLPSEVVYDLDIQRLKISLTDLLPDQNYTITVLSYGPDPRYYSETAPVQVKTYMSPGSFELKHSFTDKLELVWYSPADGSILRHNYRFIEVGVDDEMIWSSAGLLRATKNNTEYPISVEDLEPNTEYKFQVVATYNVPLDFAVYYWPLDDRFTFKTLALPTETMTGQTRMVIALVVSFAFIVVIVIITAVCICVRRRQEEKKKARQFISMYPVPDMELATLRELPHTTVQQSNTLYALNIMPTAEDVAALPHFMREQLTLTKFLGSGAFGEVFMGVARDILSDSSGDTKVAVKTLRKSASEHEKEEFLKEALLMSNFRHAHILGLLGVCLDNDPQFIIMELMEGGDLLSFLRSCRATTVSPAKLLLPDLVKVCVHVARGCKYLEEMHFVHRDLAARNCLVSKKNPSDMVIKIGDFGLARDIYKNDYYRKEGEGLLPVRWMSPESLVDGVFTTPSDIWAFGVLMWEVVTLGQQPYPARTNIEVLQYVRAGGKLERPEKVADEMFSLMQKCWSFSSEDRPSFAYILQELEEFQAKCYTMSPEEIAQRSPTHLVAFPPRSFRPISPPQSISSYGHANLAFADEVAPSGPMRMHNREEGEVAPETTTSTLQRSQLSRRGGGSAHQSPTSRRSQRMTLLGGAENEDKLIVDMSTAGPMKRTSSVDSKSSTLDNRPHVSYAQVQRQQSEMDALGYLQPRSKELPTYLELLNCAPEMGILEPVPAQQSPQSYTSSIPSSPSSPTAPAVNYALMNGNYLIPSPPYRDSPPPFVRDSNGNPHPSGTPPPGYGSQSPTYGVVTVHRNTDKPPPYHSTKEGMMRSQDPQNTKKAQVDQFQSDRAIYSRPSFERHLSDSSSNSDSSYYCVDCLNTSHCSPFKHEKSNPTYSRVSDSGFNTPPPNYSYWPYNNKERTYNGNSQSNKDIYNCPPEYINVQGRTSRNQVFPETAAVLAGLDIAQASLV